MPTRHSNIERWMFYINQWLMLSDHYQMMNKVFQVLTKCQGHHCTGNNQVPSIKTSSSVLEVVKLMPWRQAKSPLKIPSWSGGKMSSSYIFYNWHPPDQEGNFKGEVACLQAINLTTSTTEDDVFMGVNWSLPVWWCPWHLVNTWTTLIGMIGIGQSDNR